MWWRQNGEVNRNLGLCLSDQKCFFTVNKPQYNCFPGRHFRVKFHSLTRCLDEGSVNCLHDARVFRCLSGIIGVLVLLVRRLVCEHKCFISFEILIWYGEDLPVVHVLHTYIRARARVSVYLDVANLDVRFTGT